MTTMFMPATAKPSRRSVTPDAPYNDAEDKYEYYGNVRVCDVCGLIKRRTDFPLMSMKRNKQDCCRVCSYMMANNLGWKHCKCCGQNKPSVAFPKKQNGTKHCRPCMNRAVTDAELV